MNFLLKSQKIGFLGAGNMTYTILKGLLDGKLMTPDKIYVSNRSPGKLIKLQTDLGINTVPTNEHLVESSDIVILAVKPQDLLTAIEPLRQSFQPHQIVISLAAGIRMNTLKKYLPQSRLIRMMPNTPALIGKGVIGYVCGGDTYLDDLVSSLFSSLGVIVKVEDEDQLESLMIACSSGTGFVFELMSYWQDWLEEYGFSADEAKKMTKETFLGAAMLADKMPNFSFEELQNKVASKKGVTAAGLQSMRELEIDRALRISFEKAGIRSKELSNLLK